MSCNKIWTSDRDIADPVSGRELSSHWLFIAIMKSHLRTTSICLVCESRKFNNRTILEHINSLFFLEIVRVIFFLGTRELATNRFIVMSILLFAMLYEKVQLRQSKTEIKWTVSSCFLCFYGFKHRICNLNFSNSPDANQCHLDSVPCIFRDLKIFLLYFFFNWFYRIFIMQKVHNNIPFFSNFSILI